MNEPIAVALDVGGTSTKLGMVTASGAVLHERAIPYREDPTGTGLVEDVSAEICDLMAAARAAGYAVVGIGGSVAGYVDPAHDRMIFNPNLPWLEGYPLGDALTARFGLPVWLDNDGNAAALAEATYVVPSVERVLVLTVGTGVGGGMTARRELLRIVYEGLGDVGHVLVEPDGAACNSGCRGCAEAMASAPALVSYAQALLATGSTQSVDPFSPPPLLSTPRDVIVAAQAGDAVALKAVEKAGGYLGAAMASIVPILGPKYIGLTGGVCEAGAPYVEAAERRFRALCGSTYADGVRVTRSPLGWKAMLIGSAVPLFAAAGLAAPSDEGRGGKFG
jgi:glucokinase